MAKAATFEDAPLNTIEGHQGILKTGAAVHAGAMAMAGWSAGKMISAAEYDAAVKAFLNADTGRGGAYAQGR